MEFTVVKRQELIVWLYTLKQLKTVRKFGYVHYVSEKMKYAVLYVNADQVDEVMKQLNRYHFVRSIELSHRDEIDMTFKDAIPNRKDPDLKRQTSGEESASTATADTFLHDLAQSLATSEPAQEA